MAATVEAIEDDDNSVAHPPPFLPAVPGGADEVQEALGRPPAVNSDCLPLPWRGRLGYVGFPVHFTQFFMSLVIDP